MENTEEWQTLYHQIVIGFLPTVRAQLAVRNASDLLRHVSTLQCRVIGEVVWET